MSTADTNSNFSFLAEHDQLLVEQAQAAERAFASDSNTILEAIS